MHEEVGGKKKEMNVDSWGSESDEWPQCERSQHNVEISNFIKVASPAAVVTQPLRIITPVLIQ